MSRKAEYIHVSVAWPYANGDLHVGHLAGVYLPADIFARYHRLRGNHVLMVSGSDSHGTPISIEADQRGLPAEAIFEHYHRRFLRTQQKLGISYDLFTHTDTETHHRIAQNIFSLLLERDYLYREEQALLYSELENRFLPDRYVEGECYLCGFEGARGDQCDNCSQLLDATMLINPRNRAHPDDRLVVRRSEHYFLDLSQTSAALLDYLARNQAHWRSNVHSFTRNLILRGEAEGLRGRAYTRDLDWGIRVPLAGWEDKCIYVWFEAGQRLLHRQRGMGAEPGPTRGLEGLVVQPGRQNLQLHRQGQHPFPYRHLARDAARHRRPLPRGRHAGAEPAA